MNQENIQKWKVTREKGLARFLVLHGVLGWGLPMFIIMTFAIYRISLEDLSQIIRSIIIWAIGGLVFGLWMWKLGERRYRKATNQSGPE